MSVLTSVEILAFITTVHMRHLSQCHWLEKALVSLHPYSHSKNNLNAILFSTHFFALPPPDEGLVGLFRLVINSRFKRAFCLSFQNSCGNSGPLFQGSSVLFDLLALSHSSSQVFKWVPNILYQNQVQTNQDCQAPTVSQNCPAMWNVCCSVNVGKQSGYDRK